MITDKDDFRSQRSSGSRDGNSSSNANNGRTQGDDNGRKKRPRVGDTRLPVNRANSNSNSNSGSYSSSSYSQRDNGDGYSRNRGNSDSSSNSGYRSNNNNRSSYSNNRSSSGSGYSNSNGNRSNGGGYNNNGGGGSSYGNRSSYPRRDNNGSQRSGGGYGNNRSSGYGGGNKRYPSDNENPDVPRRTFSKKKVLIRPVKYKENLDPNTPLRLNKYLANAGICSRREADTYIAAGVVKVNGTVISELGAKVTRGDHVTFHDQPVNLESKIYVLLNKPRNCVTTSDDPQNRKTVMDIVKNACTERIYPVGRLDRNTTGVLLLTNDGDLASKLMHPKFKKKKIYQVKLDKDVTIEDMQQIADGIELDDGEIHADSIAYVAEDVLDEVGIEIHSGRNRVVRRIFEKLGYQVVKLDRVYFAGLTKKNLPRGKWRYLSEKEVNMLRMGAYE